MKLFHVMSVRILIVLGAGLILRLLLAYVILPGSGHASDINWYSSWAMAVTSVGPGEFYAKTTVNYPPGYIYVLWILGEVSRLIATATNADPKMVVTSLIKVPPMLLDLGTGFLLYWTIRHWLTEKESSERAALLVASCYLFNPAVLYDTAIWGQTDAAGAFVMLMGVVALLRWAPEVTASIAVVAALIKPQFGVVLIPLVGPVLLKRYTVSRDMLHAPLTPASWIARDGPLRILTSIALATIVFYVLVTPFSLDLHTYLDRMNDNAEKYKFLSVNAFNPWALVRAGGIPALFLAGIDNFSADDIPLIGSVTGVSIGTALLASGFLLGIVRLLWRSDELSVILVGVYLCLCFFLLPTRVHERYLVPVFSLTSLMIAVDRRWLWANFLLAIGSLMNLHSVLSQVGTENVTRLPFGEFVRSPAGILLSVVFQTTVFLLVIWHMYANMILFLGRKKSTCLERLNVT